MEVFRRLALLILLLSAGCRSNNDLVEAELRTKESQLQSLRDELSRLSASHQALQMEVGTLRPGGAPWLPEAAAQVLPLRSITLGRPTGGVDEDGQPGDEALQVVLEPRDAAGHTLKTPGTVFITAQEILPEGVKKLLCTWQFSGEPLALTWRSGLITTGYSLVLPWKCWPTTEKVRVIARLVLADGRAFETEKDVTIRVAPPALRRTAPIEETFPPLPPLPPLPPTPGIAPRPAEIMPRLPDNGKWTPPLPRPVSPPANPAGPAIPPPLPPPPGKPGTQPTSNWQQSRRLPLSEAIELGRPLAIPQRVEWAR